ncbi:MAG: hypothetical protein RIE58_06660 [Vicingaceae bacterium]
MGRNQNSYIKKVKAEKKRKKKLAKFEKRLDKKNLEKSGELEDMIAYVDKDGNILDEPPEEEPVKKNAKPSNAVDTKTNTNTNTNTNT